MTTINTNWIVKMKFYWSIYLILKTQEVVGLTTGTNRTSQCK